MPVIDIDPAVARDRLEAAGVTIEQGNTESERWRATHGAANAVAYADKVVIQGRRPADLEGLLRENGGRVHAYFDGASRGNPGPAAVGWVLVSGEGIVAEEGETVGVRTNNQAEYEALIRVIEAARRYGYDTVAVHGDSELIVKQIRGSWDTNDPDLRELRVHALEVLQGFDSWSIDHVPREVNERADRLANEALDDA